MKKSASTVAVSLLIVIGALPGCAKTPTLMPTPAIHAGFDLDGITPEPRRSTAVEVFYATDRRYVPERGVDPYPPVRERYLRLGVAEVQLGEDDLDWNGLAERSTASPRSTPIEARLASTDDFGALDDSTIYFDPISQEPGLEQAAERYAAMINERLAASTHKQITVYVAPFKVDFDLAVITAAEFSHFLGRDGVFITYSWPTETGALEYLSAAESAYRTRRLLRIFLEYLARETNAERINLMTYSAGARVLSGALHQLALVHRQRDPSESRADLRLGQVIFCAPDIDAGAFLEHLAEGMHNLTGQLTVYTNTDDMALKTSRFLYKWKRLGSIETEDMTPQGIRELLATDRAAYISVMNADKYDKDNGHGYFRGSPDVSSDILLMLAFDLPPDQRGLVRAPGDPVWRFPDGHGEALLELRRGLPDW